jgi:uncharacterized protein
MRAQRPLNILALVVLAVTGLAATAAQAAGFDCQKAATHIEKLICADPALSDLDSELKRVFDFIEGETFGHNAEPPYQTIDPVGHDEASWIRTVRSKCMDTACLKRVYVARIADLRRRWADALPDNEKENASLAGVYVRKETGDGGGSFVIKAQGLGWRVTADIGGIPDGAATHPDCRFEADGAVSGQAFKGMLRPDEDDPAGATAKPQPRFDFAITAGRILVHGANPMVLCKDDRVIVDGIYVKTVR